MGALEHLVIVGASAAGTATALAVRSAGWSGAVTLIGDEADLPYDRPPLSKQILTGEWVADRVRLNERTKYLDKDITLRLGSRVTGADLARREVTLADGAALQGSHLVVATGVKPRSLTQLPRGGNVHHLRTLSDAVALRGSLRADSRLLVVGGGFIGLEVAAAGRAAGCMVDVVEPSWLPLADRLGPMLGERVRELHEQAGVTFHLGNRVATRERLGDRVSAVVLTSGLRLDTDVIVVGVGSSPAVDWLQGNGLELTDGVSCDAGLRVADEVWAAGDVANVYDPFTGQHRRHEHRFSANDHSKIIAADMMGAPPPTPRPPFMWTDQYDTKIQVVGAAPPGVDPEIVEVSERGDSFVGAWTTDGLVQGLVAWNAPRLLNRHRREFNDSHAARRVKFQERLTHAP